MSFKQYIKQSVTDIDTSVVINNFGTDSYLARDPNNHLDTYMIPVDFFKANYKEVKAKPAAKATANTK